MPMQYAQFLFATAIDLAKILSQLFANNFLAIKTEPGILAGVLTVSFGEEDVCLSITANRALFVCCEAKGGMSCFTCLDDHLKEPINNLRNFSNDLSGIATRALSGFSSKTRFRHFTIPAKSRLLNYSCPGESIKNYMKMQGTNFVEIANKTNTILPSTSSLNHFRTGVKIILRHSIQEVPQVECASEMIKEILSKCFGSTGRIEIIPLKVIQRHELCKDLLALGYANVDKFSSMEMVVQQLHTTRASLSQGCKEAINIGPMEVLRFIRLDHVYKALSDPAVRQKLNLHSVEVIRKHYGFMSRGNFAATYKTYFEESPRDTLIRSKAK